MILVSPGGERTMNTYLGACHQLTPADIKEEEIGAAAITYMEGYLWDPVEAKKAFVAAAHFALSEADVEAIMHDPHTMIGSDGVAASPQGILGEDKIHPRTYGTFPRVLGSYVRDRGILSLSEAIRRMTALPAQRIGLVDRGTLRAGAFEPSPSRWSQRCSMPNCIQRRN